MSNEYAPRGRNVRASLPSSSGSPPLPVDRSRHLCRCRSGLWWCVPWFGGGVGPSGDGAGEGLLACSKRSNSGRGSADAALERAARPLFWGRAVCYGLTSSQGGPRGEAALSPRRQGEVLPARVVRGRWSVNSAACVPRCSCVSRRVAPRRSRRSRRAASATKRCARARRAPSVPTPAESLRPRVPGLPLNSSRMSHPYTVFVCVCVIRERVALVAP